MSKKSVVNDVIKEFKSNRMGYYWFVLNNEDNLRNIIEYTYDRTVQDMEEKE